eukprot:987743-Amphidinium_carterae.2
MFADQAWSAVYDDVVVDDDDETLADETWSVVDDAVVVDDDDEEEVQFYAYSNGVVQHWSVLPGDEGRACTRSVSAGNHHRWWGVQKSKQIFPAENLPDAPALGHGFGWRTL